MRLFTIGDSLCQGFMSFAGARTDLSFSTILAKQMSLKQYHYPLWEKGGIPANLEVVFRKAQKAYDESLPWHQKLSLAYSSAMEVLAEVEEYYEKGPGSADKPYSKNIDYFHNIAIWGFSIADSWLITPRLCCEHINKKKSQTEKWVRNPHAAFYRSALKVLNPQLKKEWMDFSQLDLLDKHCKERGIENTILSLGTNNALMAITTLDIKKTPRNTTPLTASHEERIAWNLWRPLDFKKEYSFLLDKVDASMKLNKEKDWRVFVCTIPLVTIAPFLRGVGKKIHTKQGTYFEEYTYFFYDTPKATTKVLSYKKVREIDDYIRAYNKSIRALVDKKNMQYKKKRYHIVDIANLIERLAFRRNDEKPSYPLPKELKAIQPPLTTEFYDASKQGRSKGGIISLDGVHPTAIGQGLIAQEFLKTFKKLKIPVNKGYDLDWKKIIASDTLNKDPLFLTRAFYEYKSLSEFIIQLSARLH